MGATTVHKLWYCKKKEKKEKGNIPFHNNKAPGALQSLYVLRETMQMRSWAARSGRHVRFFSTIMRAEAVEMKRSGAGGAPARNAICVHFSRSRPSIPPSAGSIIKNTLNNRPPFLHNQSWFTSSRCSYSAFSTVAESSTLCNLRERMQKDNNNALRSSIREVRLICSRFCRFA